MCADARALRSLVHQKKKCIFYTYSSTALHSIRRNSDHFSTIRHCFLRLAQILVVVVVIDLSVLSVCLCVVVNSHALDWHFCRKTEPKKKTSRKPKIDHIKINPFWWRNAQYKISTWRWVVAFMRIPQHNQKIYSTTQTHCEAEEERKKHKSTHTSRPFQIHFDRSDLINISNFV